MRILICGASPALASALGASLASDLANAQFDVAIVGEVPAMSNELRLTLSREPIDITWSAHSGKQKAQWKQETRRRPRG